MEALGHFPATPADRSSRQPTNIKHWATVLRPLFAATLDPASTDSCFLQQGTRTVKKLLSAAVVAMTLAVTTSVADAQYRSAPGQSLRSLLSATAARPSSIGARPIQIGVGTSAFIASAGQASEAFAGLIPGRGGLTLIMYVFVEETQAHEAFSIYVPPTAVGDERPLLVAFHGYNVSHLDIAANTSFVAECQARDWILVAPYSRNLAPTAPGTSQSSFGSVQSQVHVQAVIDYVIANFSVDKDRLYGVGFSMGGGAAMSYAARHRDRDRGAFAAVVNHTGTVSLHNTYDNVAPDTQALLEGLFGGSPASPAGSFEFARASSIEVDALGALVPGGRHMATNLKGVPLRTYYAFDDSEQYLIDQSLALHSFMSAASASHELIALPSACPLPSQQGHCWDTIDETEVCDWFAQHSFGSPVPVGQVLADRNARWGNLKVDPTATGAFAALDYAVATGQNSVRLLSTVNVDGIELDMLELGLDTSQDLFLLLGSADGTGDQVMVRSYPTLPQSVTRNGQAVVQTSGSGWGSGQNSWSYNPVTRMLLINEIDALPSTWAIAP